ncbi:cyclopropane-fatty-acyl-phospholipid synthase family protein [uncultured Shewanella sp.]|uniref:SAM-dependent methyltransferase n=1 Tax=uncultured Shewanella sp. TaxID=173975 RepID=UPI00261FE911|nr:cyclopropane-fatty-acyl-phospholipid synthase family protein [uncultured Shewanella sp.]
MEQTIKQKPSLKWIYDALIKKMRPDQQYRQLIFHILKQLTAVSLEIEENENTYYFGNQSAALSGKIKVHDVSFYQDLIFKGSIGAAQAYIAGKWSSPNLTHVIQIMAKSQQQLDAIERKTQWLVTLKNQWLRLKNKNSNQGAKRNILAHYDLGNDLYESFLDSSMLYSCAIYPKHNATLHQAQQHKMHTICQQLGLNEQDHVIEIGTGWGGLAIYMAQHYGCKVTTTTISEAQHDLAKKTIDALGLTNQITLLKQDYRQLSGQFDKLVSIEMIEAVGHEYLATFFKTCSALLKPNGKMLLQSITIADQRYEQYRKGVDFIQKYIFPGGCLPSISEIAKHFSNHTDMVIHEINDIGLHYARTLNDWRVAFLANWSGLDPQKYDEEFKRLWLFYFSYCEGAFRERVISTHQILARKPDYKGLKDEALLDY